MLPEDFFHKIQESFEDAEREREHNEPYKKSVTGLKLIHTFLEMKLLIAQMTESHVYTESESDALIKLLDKGLLKSYERVGETILKTGV